jgi:Fur family transcriptional regulator, peroxide stress response regulator
MKMTTEDIKQLLMSHNIQASNYRIRILECLSDHKKHPTADEIYQSLIEDFPSLSKMTIYNTLEVLIEAKLIRRITIEKGEARYDSALDDHGHFKCLSCGQIYNFEMNVESLTFKGLDGFKIVDKDVYFSGVCPSCQKT